MSFRFWRWQLEADRPTIEHVVPRRIEQDDVVLDDGKMIVRLPSAQANPSRCETDSDEPR